MSTIGLPDFNLSIIYQKFNRYFYIHAIWTYFVGIRFIISLAIDLI